MMSRIFGENLKKKNHMMLFELLPFFEFCTLQFCKCDISESIIGRGSKLLSACRVQCEDYMVKIKKKKIIRCFLNKCCLSYCPFLTHIL